MNKRLLLITYFFPPFNLNESRRALVVTRAAVDHGWHVHVIAPWIPDLYSSGTFDDWLGFISAPHRVHISRTPGSLREKYPLLSDILYWPLRHTRGGRKLYKQMNFPDLRASWLCFLLPRVLKLAHQIRPDVVMTTSYPYTAHVAGLITSWRYRLPWIVDTRDGWAVDESEQFTRIVRSERLRKWHRTLMSVVYKRATQVWSLTPGIRDATASHFPDQDSRKFVSIVQGYDSTGPAHEDDPKGNRPKDWARNKEFVLGYAGSFRPDLTPAEPIAAVLGRLKETNPDIYTRIRLRVWGFSSRVRFVNYLMSVLSEYGVRDRLEERDSLPEDELVAELGTCDALLITNGASPWTQKRLTTKLFTYMSARRPLLALCEPESAVAKLVREARLGAAVSPSDPNPGSEALASWVELRDAEGKITFSPDSSVLNTYSLQEGVMPLIARKLEEASLTRKTRTAFYPMTVKKGL